MRMLFLVDLVTLLPLFLVGGAGALWWAAMTALFGCVGLLLSFGHLRLALARVRSKKSAFHLPGVSLVALASLMLLLPGLLSDFIGVVAGLGSLRLLFSGRQKKYRSGAAGSFRARKARQEEKTRIIDVNYSEIDDRKKP